MLVGLCFLVQIRHCLGGNRIFCFVWERWLIGLWFRSERLVFTHNCTARSDTAGEAVDRTVCGSGLLLSLIHI